jgi:general secretion pathway protein I
MAVRPNRIGPSQCGFGLLEAIVALTLIAGAGMAIISWIGTSLIQANRLKDIDLDTRLRSAAIDCISAINPLNHPSGRIERPRLVLDWSSREVSPLLEGTSTIAAGASNYQVQLFRTSVRASDPGRNTSITFEIELAGYRAVRNIAGGT